MDPGWYRGCNQSSSCRPPPGLGPKPGWYAYSLPKDGANFQREALCKRYHTPKGAHLGWSWEEEFDTLEAANARVRAAPAATKGGGTSATSHSFPPPSLVTFPCPDHQANPPVLPGRASPSTSYGMECPRTWVIAWSRADYEGLRFVILWKYIFVPNHKLHVKGFHFWLL